MPNKSYEFSFPSNNYVNRNVHKILYRTENWVQLKCVRQCKL